MDPKPHFARPSINRRSIQYGASAAYSTVVVEAPSRLEAHRWSLEPVRLTDERRRLYVCMYAVHTSVEER